MKYRPEVDGLRTIAVLPVVMFHADASSVRGGFIGVDVFFVISGYLITSLLARDIEAGSFSLLTFYERRARRLLPALLLTCTAVAALAWFWMIPSQLLGLGKSLLSVAGFSSNIYFLVSADYFGPSAEELPLLHTWSLAVEEQFYLFYPLVLLVLWRFKGRVTAILAFGFALSLAATEVGWRFRPDENFYLLPTRAWELLAGALVARTQSRALSWSPRVLSILAAAGCAGIVASMLLMSPQTPFPSLWALVPVLSTCLVLLAASSKNTTGRVLASAPLVFVGKISYGVYLFHQPLLVFAVLRSTGTPSPALLWLLAFSSIPLAYGSWRFIEQPLRTHRASRAAVLRASLASLAAVAGIGALYVASQGAPDRYEVPEGLLQSFERAPRDCFDVEHSHTRVDWLCTVRDLPERSPDFFVAGDSHMYALMPGIKAWAEHHDLQGVHVGYSACPHLFGVFRLNRSTASIQERDCAALNERIYNHVREAGIKDVILVSRWAYYAARDDAGEEKLAYLGRSQDEKASLRGTREAFQYGLEQTVQRYAALGVRVHLVSQVPHQRSDVVNLYYRAYEHAGGGGEQALKEALANESIRLDVNRAHMTFVIEALGALRANHPEVVSLPDLTQAFCPAERCLIGTPDRSYYFDDDHLSIVGAQFAAESLIKSMKPSARVR